MQKDVARLRISDTSVNVSKQQSENTTSSGPALWLSTNKNWVEEESIFIKSVGNKTTETRLSNPGYVQVTFSNGKIIS
jgi:hypothetical protein